jgi:hypothetical protein
MIHEYPYYCGCLHDAVSFQFDYEWFSSENKLPGLRVTSWHNRHGLPMRNYELGIGGKERVKENASTIESPPSPLPTLGRVDPPTGAQPLPL